MSKTLELYEKRAKAVADARAFLDSKRGDNGALSAEDEGVYAKMEADILALGREIERESKLEAIDKALERPITDPITNTPLAPTDAKTGRASDEYKRDFFAAMRGRPVTNVLSEGVDADGGYTVPVEFDRTLVQALADANIMRTAANVITTAAPRKIAMVTQESTATWVPENGQIPESSVQFGQKTIDAFKLTDMVRISQELLADSMFNLEQFLVREFARALGAAEEEAFLVGTGNGQPTGLFSATGGADIGVTAASANAITFDDVINLVYSLRVPYRRNASFIANDVTIGALRKLKDSNGQFLWQPSLQAGQPDRLLGYPILTSPYVPAIAAGALPLSFGDYKNYWIADRQGRVLQRLVELFAQNGQIGFIITERVDGKVILSEGIKLLQMKTTT
jgi:HK97 family phage major capsid protein